MAELTPPRATPAVLALFAAWAAFTAWCLWGIPPPVDLAGHGAQLETLAGLVRGEAAVQAWFRPVFSIGYGLPHWLFLPLALLTNGAFAARTAMWCAMQLYLGAVCALARTFGSPSWVLVPALPIAFSMSYWYGLLPGVFSQSLILFSLAAFISALRHGGWRRVLVLNLLTVATLLCHLLTFVLIPVVLGSAALASPNRRQALKLAALGLVVPGLVAVPRLLTLSSRAASDGPWAATEYAWVAHLNWAFKHFRPEGHLASIAPVATVAALALWAGWKRTANAQPSWAALGTALVYAVAPKTLSGIFLVPMRIPATTGALALFGPDLHQVPKWLRNAVCALSVASLAETAKFHQEFADDTRGLTQLIARAPHPGLHGYYSLVGFRTRESFPVYLEHLGEWWTATQGGVGHNFFAHYDHHPVQYQPGKSLPINLEETTVEGRRQFDRVLVFGAGPLPEPFDSWTLVDHEGTWRHLQNPNPQK